MTSKETAMPPEPSTPVRDLETKPEDFPLVFMLPVGYTRPDPTQLDGRTVRLVLCDVTWEGQISSNGVDPAQITLLEVK